MAFLYRVTKYDPSCRDENGFYERDEWTAVSDIGKSFAGQTLTEQDYKAVEDRYVSEIGRSLDLSGHDHLRITCLRQDGFRNKLEENQCKYPGLWYPQFEELTLAEDRPVTRLEVGLISRLALRELIWCKLEIADRFYVHFGWDYYMYAGSKTEIAPQGGESEGIFWESMESPYGNHIGISGDWPGFHLFLSGPNGDEDRSIELPAMPFAKVREVLGFSGEHPAIGVFDIDQDQAIALFGEIEGVPGLSGYSISLDTTG